MSLLRPLSLLTCLAWASHALASDPSSYLDGLDALEERRWDKAQEALTRAIEQAPGDGAPRTARGLAFLLQLDLVEAQADLDQAVRLAPQVLDPSVWRDAVLRMRGKTSEIRLRHEREDVAYVASIRHVSRQYASEEFRASALAELPRLVRWFVDRAKSVRRLAPSLVKRARAKFEQRRNEEAIIDLDHAIPHLAEDPDPRFLRARVLVALEDWTRAREELTRVLTILTDHYSAYLLRAFVEAQLGCRRRAVADLDIASDLLPLEAEVLAPRIEELLAGLPLEPKREDSLQELARLEALAKDPDTPWKDLATQAMRLVRVTNGWRVRSDEVYQEGLRRVEDAVRAAPGEAIPHAERGLYLLLHESSGRPPSVDENALETQADEELDRALSIDPDCARALLGKAAFCVRSGFYDDAKELLGRIRAQGGHEPGTAGMISAVFARGSGEPGFDGKVQQLLEESVGAMSPLERETPEALCARGVLALSTPGRGEATVLLERAMRLDPDLPRGWRLLSNAFGQTGRAEEMDAILLEHIDTDDRHGLSPAGWRLHDGRWEEAQQSLMNGLRLTPASRHVSANLGCVAGRTGDWKSAAVWDRIALALTDAEEALSPMRLGDRRSDRWDDRRALSVRLHLVMAASKVGENEVALRIVRSLTLLENQLAPDEFWAPTWSYAALRLDVAPGVDTVADLIGWARILAGRIHLAEGRLNEAWTQFDLVRMYPDRCPTESGLDGFRSTLGFSTLGAAEVLYAKGDPMGARDLLKLVPHGLLPELEIERVRLEKAWKQQR